MRRRKVLVMVLAVAALMLLVAVGESAIAKEPDYQGTYAGVVTTGGGRKVPITVYAYDDGTTAVLTVSAEGYTVRVPADETWDGEQLSLSPSVPAIYSSIIRGGGSVVLAREGNRWVAAGSGAGTVLDKHEGTAQGAVERIAVEMNPEVAVTWHAENPDGSGSPPVEPRAPMLQAAESAAALAAAPLQAPLATAESAEALALIGLYAAFALVLATILFGPKIPVAELDAFFATDVVEQVELRERGDRS